MKRNIYYLSVLLLAGCMVGGCSDEQGNTANVPAASGEPIRFSVSTDNVKSRTVYDELEEDGWTLDWVTGDEIGIYTSAPSGYVEKKPDGRDRHAVYQISEVNPDGHQHEGSIAPLGTEQLVWGSQIETFTGKLDFYGAYPAERIVKYPSQDGNSFEMQYWTNQKVTVTEKVDNVYKTEPDMKNAYMIAKQAVQPSGEHILLHFDPIMTTLNITVTAGKYEVATGIINPVTVTGVSVIMPKALKDGQFVYQTDYTFKEDDDSFVTPGIHGFLKEGTVVDNNKESVFVGVEWADEAEEHTGERFVDLFEGESITLMAFLPPVEMSANSGAKIKVHTTGALNFVLEVTPEMIRQSRIEIQLPDISPESENELMVNNWISQLDGNIQLAQMSIPGYDCEDEETPGKIETLLKMGVRVFDIENIINHGGGVLGYQRRKLPDDLVKAFNSFIEKNTGEFVILLYDGDNDKNLTDTELKLSEIDINAGNWRNKSISELKGTIVAFEWRTDSYAASQTNWSVNKNQYTFNRYGIDNKEEIGEIYPNTDWNMVYMDWDKNATEGDKIDVTKTIYEKIASENKQDCSDGCTGIILVPNAGITYNQDEQYTYSDLLIQAIIDCNYKLILDRNLNQP